MQQRAEGFTEAQGGSKLHLELNGVALKFGVSLNLTLANPTARTKPFQSNVMTTHWRLRLKQFVFVTVQYKGVRTSLHGGRVLTPKQTQTSHLDP